MQMEYECYRTVKNTLRQEKIVPKSEIKMISVPAKPAFQKTSLVLGLDRIGGACATRYTQIKS